MRGPIPTEPSARLTPCDLCRETDFEVVSKRDRHGKPLNTVICRVCGLLSHEEIPSDADLAEYYRTAYRSEYHGEFEPSPHRVLRAREGGRWLLKLLRPHVAPGSRVFEVGAGTGCTVKAFGDEGFNATGIEPGVGFHRFSRRALGVEITRTSLADLEPRPQYDFVLLVHVIEHFNSPRRSMEQIRNILRPGGRLYVECPNVSAPHTSPSKLFHYAHIYNFAPETLVGLAESCGFQVRAQLSGTRARAIRFVFERVDSRAKTYSGGCYERTLASLRQYTDLTYHLRMSYLLDRAWRDVRFASHHIFAKTRVHRWTGHSARLSRRVSAVS